MKKGLLHRMGWQSLFALIRPAGDLIEKARTGTAEKTAACPGLFFAGSAHSAGTVFHQIGGFQIGDVQLDGKGILVVGF